MEGQIVKTNIVTKKSEKRQLCFDSLEINDHKEKYLTYLLSISIFNSYSWV